MQNVIVLMNDFYSAAQTNPLLAAAMMPVVGAVLYLFKDVPSRIFDLIKRQMVATMTFNNAGWSGNRDAYILFDKWFMTNKWKKMSQNFFIFREYATYENDADDVDYSVKIYRVGLGRGVHFFVHEGRFFWFVKSNLESSGSETQKEEITLKTFGRGPKAFNKLIRGIIEHSETLKKKDVIGVYTMKDGWNKNRNIRAKKLETIFLNADIRQKIFKLFSDFYNNKDWYTNKGLTYKLNVLLYGPPGTGKTSLARALAGHFGKDIYILDLSVMSNSLLLESLSTIKPGSIVLIEDIDASGSTVNRKKSDDKKSKNKGDDNNLGMLTMSGFLNALDGVIPLDDICIIMTSNHPEDIDPAIRGRKSRIDYEFLIDYLQYDTVLDYVVYMYSDTHDEQHVRELMSSCVSRDILIPGSDLENFYKDHIDDANALAERLAHYQTKTTMKVPHVISEVEVCRENYEEEAI